MGTNKQKYRDLCEADLSIPVFSQAWWLDAATPTEAKWDVALSFSGGHLKGSLPYVTKAKLGLKLVTQPPLTQKLGVKFHNVNMRRKNAENRNLGDQKKIIRDLMTQLPKYHALSMVCDETFTNWLPFYWRGFRQTTQYSYVLKDISDPDEVLSRFNSSKKGDRKKSAELVSVYPGMTATEFYTFHKNSLQKSGQKISYSHALIEGLWAGAQANDAGEIFCAKDASGNIHSAYFIVWDADTAYLLNSAIDPDFRDSSSTASLLYEVLKYISSRTQNFDFEGSMIEAVEHSYRQFGSTQRQLFRLTHVPNPLLRAAMTWKGLI